MPGHSGTRTGDRLRWRRDIRARQIRAFQCHHRIAPGFDVPPCGRALRPRRRDEFFRPAFVDPRRRRRRRLVEALIRRGLKTKIAVQIAYIGQWIDPTHRRRAGSPPPLPPCLPFVRHRSTLV
ncbi:hypothetical protein Thpro_021385 [Acidihalobacter prosperus]|uniref:Uncharacterized protein n=1 Tax=Acidihalobacter prosperus TaxID=160660 RepID=A0A1A6C3B6_9GAMM|nr:hypothetical protein Thpro_021385 [Acidihalobacter prosperus]